MRNVEKYPKHNLKYFFEVCLAIFEHMKKLKIWETWEENQPDWVNCW